MEVALLLGGGEMEARPTMPLRLAALGAETGCGDANCV